MAARILLVFDDTDLLERVRGVLTDLGHETLIFANPTRALDALESSAPVDLLITAIDFGQGQLNGVALGRMAHVNRWAANLLLLGKHELAAEAEGLGEFLAFPVDVQALIGATARLLKPSVA